MKFGQRPLWAIVAALAPAVSALADGSIAHDTERRLVTMATRQDGLVLRLNYDGRCILDQVAVGDRQVVATETGVCSAVKSGDEWFTTRRLAAGPTVAVDGKSVTVSGIVFGPPGLRITEDWRFSVEDERIGWRIDRTYSGAATIEDTYFPGWDFRDVATWTGGLLDTGGVVWTRYLDTPVATYGAHSGAVLFWNKERRDTLRITPTTPTAPTAPTTPAGAGGQHVASRFSRHPSGVFSASFLVTDEEVRPRHGLARFLADRQDVWRPIEVKPGTVRAEYTLEAPSYEAVLDRGVFVGVDGYAVGDLLNTIGRYGVVDRAIVGSNGWRSGYAVLHEPWIAQIGLAVNDEAYTAGMAAALDDAALRAIKPDGRVLSRWHYRPGDAMPGTYDAESGYYECQWGYTLDSQPSYVINVADTFDLNGDAAWLRKHRDTCRAALDFLLRRDSDDNGLVEMMDRSHEAGKCSDWIDIVWAAHENALVNAEMYEAMTRWARLEDVLGDGARAAQYRSAAARLKQAFNRPVSEGGFWNPEKGWYVYWREPDGSVHGDNLVVPVNFAAIGYGLCDDPRRCGAVLDLIESLMQKEGLFHWPLCFFPFAPEEVHASQQKFPTYENGDIFLGWGELGVRAYARHNPATAVKYIGKVLERYGQDGLSFQRYLRQTQEGAGDDILANNCNTIVGLYRDVYGVQPRHDRLWLAPRLTPELAGTQVNYTLRGRRYQIDLRADESTVRFEGLSAAARGPFGVNLSAESLQFFPFEDRGAALTMFRRPRAPLEIRVEAWPRDPGQPRVWTERPQSGSAPLRHVVSDLRPGTAVRVLVDGKLHESHTADNAGRIEVQTVGVPGRLLRVEVVPE